MSQHVEAAFHAKFKGKKPVARDDKKATENQGSKGEGGEPRKGKYPPCHYCKKTNHIEKNCLSKNKRFFYCNYCNKDGQIESYCRAKINQTNRHSPQQANCAKDQKEDTKYLFVATHVDNKADLVSLRI